MPYPARPGHRPFRYLGRVLARELWPARPAGEHVDVLTAVGFGLTGGNGALRLRRLVDTFGQTRDVDCGTVVPAESRTVPGNPDLVAMPPRISRRGLAVR
ncbi:hypothetical protein KZZ52_43145 [Dactylosporangium sp. AC04546]|uniref:hypothetical protein n=1 Tax=Dactylosporangium sp. AC04546 TaxID=2862460 RepID=UPI001EDE3EE4|nr:hypothetical protein [Dactylosporangium sp. AC04546]WVK80710.1 hypothetical protein KZZ52_43145 [Dactylosporangium sp. AC04546]